MNKKQKEVVEFLQMNFWPERDLLSVVEVLSEPDDEPVIRQGMKSIPYAAEVLNMINENARAERMVEYLLGIMETGLDDILLQVRLIKTTVNVARTENHKQRLLAVFEKEYADNAPAILSEKDSYDDILEILRRFAITGLGKRIIPYMDGIGTFCLRNQENNVATFRRITDLAECLTDISISVNDESFIRAAEMVPLKCRHGDPGKGYILRATAILSAVKNKSDFNEKHREYMQFTEPCYGKWRYVGLLKNKGIEIDSAEIQKLCNRTEYVNDFFETGLSYFAIIEILKDTNDVEITGLLADTALSLIEKSTAYWFISYGTELLCAMGNALKEKRLLLEIEKRYGQLKDEKGQREYLHGKIKYYAIKGNPVRCMELLAEMERQIGRGKVNDFVVHRAKVEIFKHTDGIYCFDDLYSGFWDNGYLESSYIRLKDFVNEIMRMDG